MAHQFLQCDYTLAVYVLDGCNNCDYCNDWLMPAITAIITIT